jgi:TPR repeat protein
MALRRFLCHFIIMVSYWPSSHRTIRTRRIINRNCPDGQSTPGPERLDNVASAQKKGAEGCVAMPVKLKMFKNRLPVDQSGVVASWAMAVVIALGLSATTARADFTAGVTAFHAGSYQAAYTEWLPIAESGNAPAQYNVGVLFHYGLGVAKDFSAAAEWYRLAASQSHPNAQAKLGYLLARGFGVEKDFAESARWFREAAEQGVVDAQFNIGVMYATGSGIEYDPVQGLMWLTLAHQAGITEAKERLDELAAKMSPDDIDEATLLAEFLKPEAAEAPATPDANETGFATPPAPAPEPPPSPAAIDLPPLELAEADGTPPSTSDSTAPAAAQVQSAMVELPAQSEAVEIDTTPELPPTPATSVSASLALALATLAPPPPPPMADDVVVHLASYLSAEAAATGWAKLRTVHADLLGSLGHNIVKVDLGDQGLFYRLLAGPMTDQAGAETLCDRLKARNIFCTADY